MSSSATASIGSPSPSSVKAPQCLGSSLATILPRHNEGLMTTLVEEVPPPPPPDLTNFIVKCSNQYSNGGSFGDVYRCWYDCGADAPKEVVVKAFRFRLENASSSRFHKMIRRELGIWRRLNHRNIVPFLGIAYGFGMQGALSLVSLWMTNDTLLKFLEKHDHELSVGHRLQLLLDIASGLDHLHSFPIVHGDLNCNNVLLDGNYTARLADFGYASLVGNIPEALAYLEMSTTRPGAMRWAAPEQVFPQAGFKLTTKSDMYSFGCISLQVLSGKKPWSEIEKDSNVVLCVAQGRKPRRPETREIDDRYWDFIQWCWLSVQERPSATEAITCIQQFLNYYTQSLLLHDIFVSPTTQLDSPVNVANDPSFALTLVPGENNDIRDEHVDVHPEQEAGFHLPYGGIHSQVPASQVIPLQRSTPWPVSYAQQYYERSTASHPFPLNNLPPSMGEFHSQNPHYLANSTSQRDQPAVSYDQSTPPRFHPYLNMLVPYTATGISTRASGTVSQKARHSLMPLSSSLKCHYCDKEFSQPSGLKIHQNIHAGEKPYFCTFEGCGRSYSVRSHMDRHKTVKGHHNSTHTNG